MDIHTEPEQAPDRPAPAAQPSMREGLLRLLALLCLLGFSARLYTLAGPATMSTVATAGTALFATWQHRGGGR